MPGILKRNWFLLLIIFAALFFYTFRANQTFVMASDTARDLLRVMEIWKNKEITVIGPPVNTIGETPIQVYFGSLHYYFGLLGLLVFNFNPIGSIFLNVVITITSIPFFFVLSKEILKKNNLTLTSTAVYALSPVTIALTRSYWNPNLIIPLGVFFWYFLLRKESYLKHFVAGLILGIIFNLHYVNAIPLATYIGLLFFKRDKRYFLSIVSGFILAMLPLIAFELKNNFFLIKAFVTNTSGFSTFSGRSVNPFLSMDSFFYIFGLGPPDFYIPGQVNLAFNYRIVLDTVIGIAFIYFVVAKQKILNPKIVSVIIFGLLVGWYFEKWHLVHMRYLLSVYPLFIISFIAAVSKLNKYLVFVLIIPMLTMSIKIITHKLNPNIIEDYYPLKTVEAVSKAIVDDNPSGKYNVTENILGDARSLAYKYFLMKDAQVQPQPFERYDRIDVLYVVTPSLEKTYKESRWEFVASGPKRIAWERDFDGLKLYKFVK